MAQVSFSFASLRALLQMSSEPLFLDIGSSTTRIGSKDTILWEQPTCVVLHQSGENVVAVGNKALALVGKAPRSVSVIFPVQDGVVAHPRALAHMLEAALREVSLRLSALELVFGKKVIVALPGSITPVEKQQLQAVMREVSLSRVAFIDQGTALFRELIPQPSATQAYCLLDIGGQTSQLTLVSVGQVYLSKTIPWGGTLFTDLIQQYVQKKHECIIGWHEAEKVKKGVGAIPLLKDKKEENKRRSNRKIAVRGKDSMTQMSKTVIINSDELADSFGQQAQDLYDGIEAIFFDVPAQITTNALEQGIFLSGGGSQLEGLALSLSDYFQTSVHVSKHPHQDVIHGLMKS